MTRRDMVVRGSAKRGSSMRRRSSATRRRATVVRRNPGLSMRRRRKPILPRVLLFVVMAGLVVLLAKMLSGFGVSRPAPVTTIEPPTPSGSASASVTPTDAAAPVEDYGMGETYPELVKLSVGNYLARTLLKNNEQYPEFILEMAERNPETLDFCVKYTDRPAVEIRDVSAELANPGIPLLLQWDARWGYNLYATDIMAVSGCGPTALAMVASGLTGNPESTPAKLAEYAMQNGYVDGGATSWSFMSEAAEAFGLYVETVVLDDGVIRSKLNAGMPIIVSVRPGDFTTTGHFIVLVGLDSTGEVIVNDPFSRVRSEKRWDLQVIMDQAKQLWAFRALGGLTISKAW